MTKIAIIGSGPAGLGYLLGLVESLKKKTFKKGDVKIEIFEKSAILGAGLPYNEATTDVWNLMNTHVVASATPSTTNRREFFDWLQKPENQKRIDEMFFDLFHERFKEKFQDIFGVALNETGLPADKTIFDKEYRLTLLAKYSDSQFGNLREILDQHVKTYERLKSRYLRYDLESEYVPRIVRGLFLRDHYQTALNELKELVGEENVTIHTNAEVKTVGSDSCLTYVQDGVTVTSEKFDRVAVATGLSEKEPDEQDKDTGYVRNVWPIQNVLNALKEKIAKAKAEGKSEVIIATEGTSLSAADMHRAILFSRGQIIDGKYVDTAKDGVKVKVEMVSRNGYLPMVKSSFNWTKEEYMKYFPIALKKTLEDYGVAWPVKKGFEKFAEDNDEFYRDLGSKTHIEIEEIGGKFWSNLQEAMDNLIKKIKAQNPDGKIYIWQLVKVYSEILVNAYEATSLPEKAQATREFIKFVEENKNNYKKILEGFLKIGYSSDAFEDLKNSLETAVTGEFQGDEFNHLKISKNSLYQGDNISAHIYELFLDFAAINTRQDIPGDEKLFRSVFRGQVLLPYTAPLAPEAARDMLAFHDAGVLTVKACGKDTKLKLEAGSDPIFVDSKGNEHHYDLIVKASENAFVRKRIDSSLYHSIIENFGADSNMDIFANAAEFEEAKKLMSEKYGEDQIAQMLSLLKKSKNGFVINLAKLNLRQDSPVELLRDDLYGLGGSVRNSAARARKFIENCEFTSERPSVDPALVSMSQAMKPPEIAATQ